MTTGKSISKVAAKRSNCPAKVVALCAVAWNEYVIARETPIKQSIATRISVLRIKYLKSPPRSAMTVDVRYAEPKCLNSRAALMHSAAAMPPK